MPQPKGQKEQAELARISGEAAQADIKMKQQLMTQMLGIITPLVNLGIDPTQFINSALGQSILGTQRAGVAGEFGQARQTAMEQFGTQGMTGSGVAAGPYANLLGQEARAMANLTSQMPQTGLNLMLQAAGLLSGQQQLLDPRGFLGTGIQGYGSLQQRDIFKPIMGAIGAALSGPAGSGLGSLMKGGGGGGDDSMSGEQFYNEFGDIGF